MYWWTNLKQFAIIFFHKLFTLSLVHELSSWLVFCYSYQFMVFNIIVSEIQWNPKYLVHEPELHAGFFHNAHIASSSSAAQPGRTAESSVAQSSGLIHSNLLPV